MLKLIVKNVGIFLAFTKEMPRLLYSLPQNFHLLLLKEEEKEKKYSHTVDYLGPTARFSGNYRMPKKTFIIFIFFKLLPGCSLIRETTNTFFTHSLS